jgi:hypothetical protein
MDALLALFLAASVWVSLWLIYGDVFCMVLLRSPAPVLLSSAFGFSLWL